ncbi:23S rRNA (uracil(1939)-C(5))-methyltransferase RlmD [Candidatus Poribacteria bacterium]|nr:23S rRNA (uracil(1939)-C(5))-methyltransferase RlmD [Candidatus Poribacteria bacterium]
MFMIPLQKEQIIETEITEITYKGKAVCRIDNFVVFLNNGVPGDKVRAKITELKKKYAYGEIIDLIKPSSFRIDPICQYFYECGGCQLQYIDYINQLSLKELMVRDSLWHIGKISLPINKIIPSSKYYEYRNQIQLKIEIGEKAKLGFFSIDTHKIVKIDNCFLQTKIGNRILNGLNKFFNENGNKLFFKYPCTYKVIIRVSEDEKKVLIIFEAEGSFIYKSDSVESELTEQVSSFLINMFPEIQCIIKYAAYQSPHILFGNDDFSYSVHDINFHISLRDFWQINFTQINVLSDIVLKFAGLTGKETVLDAYCGVGLFTLLIALECRFVYGVELNPEAIYNARKNAGINNVLNVKFIEGDVEKVIMSSRFPNIDIIIVDPPRKGLKREVLSSILKIKPGKIIYVSCDPATLSRDLQILITNDYNLKEIQPIDMFPQTYHIECVAYLEAKY